MCVPCPIPCALNCRTSNIFQCNKGEKGAWGGGWDRVGYGGGGKRQTLIRSAPSFEIDIVSVVSIRLKSCFVLFRFESSRVGSLCFRFVSNRESSLDFQQQRGRPKSFDAFSPFSLFCFFFLEALWRASREMCNMSLFPECIFLYSSLPAFRRPPPSPTSTIEPLPFFKEVSIRVLSALGVILGCKPPPSLTMTEECIQG